MCLFFFFVFVFFQAEDGIRDLVRSRGLGDVYKRQRMRLTERLHGLKALPVYNSHDIYDPGHQSFIGKRSSRRNIFCLLYTSDAADERSSVDLGGRRIIKKKTNTYIG